LGNPEGNVYITGTENSEIDEVRAPIAPPSLREVRP